MVHLSLLLLVFLVGCGKKGPPQAPLGHRPGPISGFSARQQGNTILLEAILPSQHTNGRPLEETPAVRIVRVLRGGKPYTVERFLPAELDAVPGGKVLFRLAVEDVFRDSSAEKVTLQLILEPARGKPSVPRNSVEILRAEPPTPPAGVSAVNEEAGVRLTWKAAASATETLEYLVYRRESSTSEWEGPLGGRGLIDPTYFDRDVSFGRSYDYEVRAGTVGTFPPRESAAGNGVQVERVDRFAPAPPSDVRAVASPEGTRVFWFPPDAPDLEGFLVYRQTAAATAELLARLPAETSFYLDQAVEAGLSYTYTMVAFDDAVPPNESSVSEPAVETAAEPER